MLDCLRNSLLLLCDLKYTNLTFNMFYIITGFGFTFIGHQVPAHTVKNIWLLAGGQKVRIHTYGPFLSTKEMIVPLSNMTCTVLPEPGEENKDVSFKIKGSRLFYSVECKGDFLQPKLFNSTVGMYRKNFNQ